MARTKEEIKAELKELQIDLYRLETNPSQLFAIWAETKMVEIKERIAQLEKELEGC